MFDKTFQNELSEFLQELHDQGLYKQERILEGPQSSVIEVSGKKVLNFCANNYLGLSNHPEVIAASAKTMQEWGFGLSSVRF
ncbi:MAG: glycine C-acetyltransferase, partial [Sphaerochaetaceae bacterium]